MLTEEETRLLAHAYALRHDEPPGRDVWFCPDNLLFAEAARLWERGLYPASLSSMLRLDAID